MTRPDITVVIPTRFRETRLAFALDGLAEQTLARERFEVIAVRAADAVDGPLTEAPPGLEVRFLVAPVAGAAAQRNVGWRAGGGRLVAFMDDDCRPAPDWLERLLEEARDPDVFLQGRTEPEPEEKEILRGWARSMTVTELDVWAPTCNIAYPRELLERLGGFDESFPGAWGEDTDLAMRARGIGGRQRYVERALVYHAVHPRSILKAIGEATSRNTIPGVVARHPELRRALDGGVFVKREHGLVTLGLAVATLAVVARRPLLAPLGFVPYARWYLRDHRLTSLQLLRWFLISGPRAALLDAIETAALGLSSARSRTLVL